MSNTSGHPVTESATGQSGKYRPPEQLYALVGDRGFVRVQQPSAEQRAKAVELLFEEGKGQPGAQLKAGGKLVIVYDPDRTKVYGSANGVPSYGVQAFVRLEPGGQIIEKPCIGFEQADGRILGIPYSAPVLVELPKGTTGVTLWFRQFSYGDRTGAEAWDSNFGHNYRFEIR